MHCSRGEYSGANVWRTIGIGVGIGVGIDIDIDIDSDTESDAETDTEAGFVARKTSWRHSGAGLPALRQAHALWTGNA